MLHWRVCGGFVVAGEEVLVGPNRRGLYRRMKSQEVGRGVAGTLRYFAWVGAFDDAEQQVDLQIAPEQASELGGKSVRTTCEQSGRLGCGHDLAKGGATGLTRYGVEHT